MREVYAQAPRSGDGRVLASLHAGAVVVPLAREAEARPEPTDQSLDQRRKDGGHFGDRLEAACQFAQPLPESFHVIHLSQPSFHMSRPCETLVFIVAAS